MSRCVVVGGGLAGMAAAARLAALGHDVTLLERRPVLGGAVERIERDGFAWDAGPHLTLLPAALRDLFGSTGPPLEAEVALTPVEVVREHWFADGSTLALPGGSRTAQAAAVDALGPGLGEQWLDYVASSAEDWDVLRRGYLEQPWQPADLPAPVAARLDGRGTLHRRLRRAFRDDRLRQVAAHPLVAEGHHPRDVPAWAGLVTYLEQRFGGWTAPGGLGAVTAALARRLRDAEVAVQTGVRVLDVVVREGRAVAVGTDRGEVDAEVVVCAVDPRLLPTLAPYVGRTLPAMPPVLAHVGVAAPPRADLGSEVVLHVDPLLVVRPGVAAPEGAAAYTVHGRGRVTEDLLVALARQGVDLREDVVTRVDLTARDQVERWGSSPYGVLWQGRGTVRHRLGPATPLAGVYACGAHATPGTLGAGVAMVTLSANLVAQAVGSG